MGAVKLSELREILSDWLGPEKPGPRFRVVRWGKAADWDAMVAKLRQALADLAAGRLDAGEIRRLARSLVTGQRRAFGRTAVGSWAICRHDRGLSDEERERLIHLPTRLGVALLSRIQIEHSKLAQAIPGFRPALAQGMAAVAQLPVADGDGDGDGDRVLAQGRVADMLRLDPTLCPGLAEALGVERPRPAPCADRFPAPPLGRAARLHLARMDGWDDIETVVSNPDGATVLLVGEDRAARRLATFAPDGAFIATELGQAIENLSAAKWSIAPWGGHAVSFGKTYSHTDSDGERNIYSYGAVIHALPSGRALRQESLFRADSTAGVSQVMWDDACHWTMLHCGFALDTVPLDSEAPSTSFYVRREGLSCDCNFRFIRLEVRPRYRSEGNGLQFIGDVSDGGRSDRFHTVLVTDLPSGRQWFLDGLVWRPWPQGYHDRQKKPAARPNIAVYDRAGRDILVLYDDGILRTWSADDFRPGPSRSVEMDRFSRNVSALPGGKVAVWDKHILIIDSWCDEAARPIRWKADGQNTATHDLSAVGLLGVLVGNRGGGNTLHLLAQEDGRAVWVSSAHLPPVEQVHPYGGGLIIRDRTEQWWRVGLNS